MPILFIPSSLVTHSVSTFRGTASVSYSHAPNVYHGSATSLRSFPSKTRSGLFNVVAAQSSSEQKQDTENPMKELIIKLIRRPIFNHDHFGEPYLTAENEKRFLSASDLDNIHASFTSTQNTETFALVRCCLVEFEQNLDTIILHSRKTILEQFPGIDQEGGALYPPERAQACWRDLWQFARVVSYGALLQSYDNQSSSEGARFLNSDGMKIMDDLYQVMRVPLDAMICGIAAMKTNAKGFVSNKVGYRCLETAFDELTKGLARFNS